ncbi:uncharacterized protein J4E87_005668 [Alternaria ethzedia]|uniref:uncharacterized protein n=1 Tax=Alternaria ethzedia TaxID=181014 RepID=UPI0020C26BDC|nr:uncharacterized protein J4E87_005668 [Alternaria ethzedia]KAI4624169.1 hypothetical protein J4E87_005668 [Alternaria ethzedia]
MSGPSGKLGGLSTSVVAIIAVGGVAGLLALIVVTSLILDIPKRMKQKKNTGLMAPEEMEKKSVEIDDAEKGAIKQATREISMADFKPYSDQPELHAKAPYRAAMLTQPANLKQALKDAQADASKTLMGIAQGIPSTFVTKLIASTKPDFIWMDVEHGMYNRLTLHDCIHAAQHHSEGKSMVICRVPKHDELSLTTALDAGCAGIVIPHVESAQEVRDFIKEMYFGDGKGHRSFSPWVFTPGLTQSLYPNDPYNVQTANNHVCLIPQIESLKGLEACEEIAAVEGISGLMFGPGDYMIDAGMDIHSFMNGNPDPKFFEAMGKFNATAAKYDLPIFGGVMGLDQIPMAIQTGMRGIAVQFDVWGTTRLFASSLEAGWKHAKSFEGNPKPSMANGQAKPAE